MNLKISSSKIAVAILAMSNLYFLVSHIPKAEAKRTTCGNVIGCGSNRGILYQPRQSFPMHIVTRHADGWEDLQMFRTNFRNDFDYALYALQDNMQRFENQVRKELNHQLVQEQKQKQKQKQKQSVDRHKTQVLKDEISKQNQASESKENQVQGEDYVIQTYHRLNYEINEDESKIVLTLDVPGVKPLDINIDLEQEGKVLRVKGLRRGKSSYKNQKIQSQFEQVFTIDPNVLDVKKLEANMTDGVLVLTAPKLKKAKGKEEKFKIPIHVGSFSGESHDEDSKIQIANEEEKLKETIVDDKTEQNGNGEFEITEEEDI